MSSREAVNTKWGTSSRMEAFKGERSCNDRSWCGRAAHGKPEDIGFNQITTFIFL